MVHSIEGSEEEDMSIITVRDGKQLNVEQCLHMTRHAYSTWATDNVHAGQPDRWHGAGVGGGAAGCSNWNTNSNRRR